MNDIEIGFERPKAVRPTTVTNSTLQTIRVDVKEDGGEVTIVLYGRHEKDKGTPLAPGQSLKVEEEA